MLNGDLVFHSTSYIKVLVADSTIAAQNRDINIISNGYEICS